MYLAGTAGELVYNYDLSAVKFIDYLLPNGVTFRWDTLLNQRV